MRPYHADDGDLLYIAEGGLTIEADRFGFLHGGNAGAVDALQRKLIWCFGWERSESGICCTVCFGM